MADAMLLIDRFPFDLLLPFWGHPNQDGSELISEIMALYSVHRQQSAFIADGKFLATDFPLD